MSCDFKDHCGGCAFRNLSFEEYQEQKRRDVLTILNHLHTQDFRFAEPFFVGDNQRRRAAFAFEYKKGKLILGFNEKKSDTIIDIDHCALLTPRINANLQNLRRILESICAIKFPLLKKNKKPQPGVFASVNKGDLLVCEADNGLDIVLEFDAELNLDYRMSLFELSQQYNDIIRISHRKRNQDSPEAIVEKTKPQIDIADFDVYIPAGTFLQASKASEQALINIVAQYIGDDSGKIADLFCGVGTFSYPLSKNMQNKIVAIDSSKELLEGFRRSVNKNMIPNIEIIEKNLFKYPLDEKELKDFDIIVFDPPRAGASAQMKKIAEMDFANKPRKIIAVSCNPHSFVKDAEILIDGGYHLEEITLVDQFNYSNHSELVALFTK